MPLCIIDTNATKFSPDLPARLIVLLAERFNKPEKTVMIEINTKKTFFHRGGAPCAYVQCRALQNISREENAKTAELLNEIVAECLAIHRTRIFIEFVKVKCDDLAVGGNLLENPGAVFEG
uniref:L-dopachrome isomerase n=1 Tax=Steinernema glaseri TaxID=37863 RepID=A0A1I7Z843_9BILA